MLPEMGSHIDPHGHGYVRALDAVGSDRSSGQAHAASPARAQAMRRPAQPSTPLSTISIAHAILRGEAESPWKLPCRVLVTTVYRRGVCAETPVGVSGLD